MEYKVGDRVEIARVTKHDREWGVKVGDVAKVTGSFGGGWYFCHNPEWEHLEIYMKIDQIKKLS